MSERSLISHTGSSWTYDDQQKALAEGFNSVTEWGLWHLVRKVEKLEGRIAELEGSTVEIVQGDPED